MQEGLFIFVSGIEVLNLDSSLVLLAMIHCVGSLFEMLAFREDVPVNNYNDASNEEKVTEMTNLVSEKDNTDMNMKKDSQKQQATGSNNKKTMNQVSDVTGLQLMKNTEFWLVSGNIIISISVDKTFLYNIGTYMRSFHMKENNEMIFIAGCIFAIISKIVIGILIHTLQDKTQRMTFQCVALTVKTVTFALFIFYGDHIVILGLASLAVYFSTPIEFMVAPIITLEYYGAKYYARNFGSILFVSTIITLILQALVGIIYEKSTDEYMYTCYGLGCFYLSSFILLFLTFTALLFSIFVWKERRNVS